MNKNSARELPSSGGLIDVESLPLVDVGDPVVVDCDSCAVRSQRACGDCVVAVLLGPPPELVVDPAEQAALSALAAGGLIPPLRLVVAEESLPLSVEAG